MQFALGSLTVGDNHFATQQRACRVLFEALHLQKQFAMLVLVVGFGNG